MPQMFQYCGQKFQIYKRAHKTCDTVSGHTLGLQMPNSVHLEHRCDGQAYGGFQAQCLIFWKEAWLKPAGGGTGADLALTGERRGSDDSHRASRCTVDDVWNGTQNGQHNGRIKYVCQATQLLQYTTPLNWWDPRQYVEDYRSGNATLKQIFNGFVFFGSLVVTLARSDRSFGRPGRWL